MGAVARALWSLIVIAVVATVVAPALNDALGDGWYDRLTGGPDVNHSQGPGGTGCRQPSAETTGKLPQLPDGYRRVTNPCLSFVEVLAKLDALVPKAGADQDGEAGLANQGRAKFHRGVAAASKRLGQLVVAKDAVQCGYATDRLAVALYQATKPAWSAGVVAVLRGDLDAITDIGVCTLLRQIPGLGSGTQDAEPPPRLSFCFNARKSGAYTVFWLGSTDAICDAFAARIGAGPPAASGPMSWGDPLNLRAAARPDAQQLTAIPFGAPVAAECVTTGTSVTGYAGQPDAIWVRVTYQRKHGYVAGGWLVGQDRRSPLEGLDDCTP